MGFAHPGAIVWSPENPTVELAGMRLMVDTDTVLQGADAFRARMDIVNGSIHMRLQDLARLVDHFVWAPSSATLTSSIKSAARSPDI